jgi:hypothetical protein
MTSNGTDANDQAFWDRLCDEFAPGIVFTLDEVVARLDVGKGEARDTISRIVYCNMVEDEEWDELRITEGRYIFPGVRR